MSRLDVLGANSDHMSLPRVVVLVAEDHAESVFAAALNVCNKQQLSMLCVVSVTVPDRSSRVEHERLQCNWQSPHYAQDGTETVISQSVELPIHLLPFRCLNTTLEEAVRQPSDRETTNCSTQQSEQYWRLPSVQRSGDVMRLDVVDVTGAWGAASARCSTTAVCVRPDGHIAGTLREVAAGQPLQDVGAFLKSVVNSLSML